MRLESSDEIHTQTIESVKTLEKVCVQNLIDCEKISREGEREAQK